VNVLADYTDPSLLLPECSAGTAPEVIAELARALDQAGRLTDRAAFLGAVMAREKLSPTSLPVGWATPHARLQALPRLSFGLARIARPFRWMGGSEVPIRLVWLFAVPETESKAYLHLIAGVVRLGQEMARVQELFRAPDAMAMNQVLEQVALRRPQTPAAVGNRSPHQKPG